MFALVFLIFVLLMVVGMITLFIFPPTKWVKWFYNQSDSEKK